MMKRPGEGESTTYAVAAAVAFGIALSACDKPAPPPPPPPAPPAAAPAPAVAAAPVAAAPTPAVSPPAAPAAAPAAPQGVTPPAAKAPAIVLTPAPKATPLHAPAQSGRQPVNLIGAIASLPADWKQTQPANAMRVAQFATPAAKNGELAELVVFFFAPGRGGSQEENIGRWKSQFSGPKGAPVEPRVRHEKIGSVPVTRVELEGNYSRGVGMGSDGGAKPDQILLAAIVTTPTQGNLTLHFFGHKLAVNQYREAFDEVVNGLKFSGH